MKIKRYLFFLTASPLLILLAWSLSSWSRKILTNKPPVEAFSDARKFITEAKNVGADRYSPSYFKKSVELYDSAICCWKAENERIILKRDYSRVSHFVIQSKEFAEKACAISINNSHGLGIMLSKKLEALTDSIKVYDSLINRFPLPHDIRTSYSSGKLLLEEVRFTLAANNLLVANKKLSEAEHKVQSTHTFLFTSLEKYFSQQAEWQEMARRTIETSKRNRSTAIVVDKFAQSCYVYRNGALKYTFDVDLGPNWIGEKRHKGDKATPEGLYKVIDIKQGSRTKYHKALLIDYPNGDDKKRFERNKKSGLLSSYIDIGGLIEIHGHGGKGANWTEGCVALANHEMDMLFRVVNVGTPVTIVGSLRPLADIIVSRNDNQHDNN